ncbi:hypothetical protein Tdes44962_MAKER05810 [Teratosphaeria destructans]|uniref:Uncharacterized protein n=1 Tax=Teratosphaeria destructans TaxID=418781 RepID=A0A9W7SIW5_9PEZI|nr:hypothetical protein Tdes44962_MAKER05810 [Teratosphaeria destructans]
MAKPSTMHSLCAHITTVLALILGLGLSTFLPSALLTDVYSSGGTRSQHLFFRFYVFPHRSTSTASQPFNPEAVAGSLATLSVAMATVAHVTATYVLLDRLKCQKTAGLFAVVPPGVSLVWALGVGWSEGLFVADLLSVWGYAQMAICVGIMWKGVVDILGQAMVARALDVQEDGMAKVP